MAENIATTVLREVSRIAEVQFEYVDDDVFLNQLPEEAVFSDIQPPYNSGMRPQSAGQVPRPRRASDVIDCLGEEFVTMRPHHGSDPYSIPVSPRSRSSSDHGYSGSVTSSPATTNFNFSSGMIFPPAAPPLPPPVRGTNTTDSRPVVVQAQDQSAKDDLEATMPVPRDAEAYEMRHARRGRAIIFNHDTFDNNMASSRMGSHVDVLALEAAFQLIGFQVTTFQNLTHTEIKEVTKSLAKEDHSDADCLALTVLSHGLDNGLVFARDVLYPVDALWQPFAAENCPTLAGKPKLFFVQACRGDKLDGGVTLVSQSQQRRSMSETDSGCAAYKIPNYGDFLISYSAMDGFFSWRNPEEGTWYVQSLATELTLHGTKRNILDIMTRVTRRVALLYQSNVEERVWMNNQKQCPVYHSSLMRDLVFHPKT